MSYIGNSPGVASQRVTTTLTASAGQTQFTAQSGYVLGYVDVYLNGAKLVNGSDFEAITGTFITLFEAAAAGDVVELISYVPRGLSDGYTKAEADAKFLDVGGDTASGSLSLAAASLTGNLTLSGGTVNAIAYLNGSKVVTSGSGLTFDGTNFATTGNITGSNLAVSNTNWIGWGNYNTRLAGDSVNHTLTFSLNAAEQARLTTTGLGIGTSSPSYKLHVVGDGYISNRFIQGSLTSYPMSTNNLSLGTSTWIRLFTISSPGSCRVRYLVGSQNSEEQGEFSIRGTYIASATQIEWSRQTYNANLTEIRVTGSDSGPYTVWALVRTTEFAPFFSFQVVEAVNAVTVHNTTGQTPGTAIASLNAPTWNGTTSTHDGMFNGNLSVGINTVNNNKLTVYGQHVAGRSHVAIRTSDSATGSPAIIGFYNSADARVGSVGHNMGTSLAITTQESVPIIFNLADIERARITAAGNLGIGTSTPGERLEVQGNIRLDGPSGTNREIYFRNQGSGDGAAIKSDKALTFYAGSGSGSPTLYMTLQEGGNLGIGTTSPSARLHVRMSRTSSTSGVALWLSDTVTGGQTNGVFKSIRSGSNNDNSISEIRFIETDGTNNNTAIGFATQATAGGLTERMRVGPDGNVAIGTINPDGWRLNVTGNAISNGGDVSNLLTLRASTNSFLSFRAANEGGTAYQRIISTDGIQLHTSNVERMRIDPNGNVAIGATSAGGKFTVLQGTSQLDVGTNSTRVYLEAINRENIGGTINFEYYARNGSHIWYNGAYSERVRIDPQGDLIVGDSSTIYKFDVNGDAGVRGANYLYMGHGSIGTNWGVRLRSLGGQFQVDAGAFRIADDGYTGSKTWLVGDTTGRVGIGTNPVISARLDVAGPVKAGRTVYNWYQWGGNPSGRYHHIKTSLWSGGSPNGQSQPTMSLFHIKGYNYDAHTIDAMIGFHNWSGAQYSVRVTNAGSYAGSHGTYTSTDGFVVLVIDTGTSYPGISIDYFQSFPYSYVDVTVTASSSSTATTGVY